MSVNASALARPRLGLSSRRAPETVLGVVVLLELALHLHFTHTSWFAFDDLFNFNDSLRKGLSWNYLREPLFGHFLPGHHLADGLLQRVFPLNFGVALGIMCALWAASVFLLHALLDVLGGRSWWNVYFAALFGLSIAFVPSLQWWTAGLLTMPAMVLGLGCLLLFEIGSRRGSTPAMAGSVACYAGSLLFYEKGTFVFGYVVLSPILLSGAPVTARHVLGVLRRHWRVYAVFAVVSAVYLWNYRARYYDPATPTATLHQLEQYLRIVWLRGIGPAAFGLTFPGGVVGPVAQVAIAAGQLLLIGAGVVFLRVTDRRLAPVLVLVAAVVFVVLAGVPDRLWGPGLGGLPRDLAAVNGQWLLLGLIAVTLLRDRGAWRAWAFLAVGLVLNTVVVGFARVGQFGPDVAYDVRYLAEVAYLLPLGIALALRPPGGRTRSTGRPPAAVFALAAGFAVVLAVGYWSSAKAIQAVWPAPIAKHYIDNVQKGIVGLRRLAGDRFTLVDGVLPEQVVPSFLAPYNRVSNVFGAVDDRLTYNRADLPPYVVRPDGSFQRSRFRPALDTTTVSGSDKAILQASASRVSTRCVRSPAAQPASFTIRPRRPLMGSFWFLRFRYSADRAAHLLLSTDYGNGFPAAPNRDVTLPAGRGTGLVDLGSDTVLLTVIAVPPGVRMCLDRVQVGAFAAA